MPIAGGAGLGGPPPDPLQRKALKNAPRAHVCIVSEGIPLHCQEKYGYPIRIINTKPIRTLIITKGLLKGL